MKSIRLPMWFARSNAGQTAPRRLFLNLPGVQRHPTLNGAGGSLVRQRGLIGPVHSKIEMTRAGRQSVLSKPVDSGWPLPAFGIAEPEFAEAGVGVKGTEREQPRGDRPAVLADGAGCNGA